MRQLIGSEKQVAWANDIRDRMLAGAVAVTKKRILEGGATENMLQVIRDIQDITSAKWFIDNRFAGIQYNDYTATAFFMAWQGINTYKSIWADDRGAGEYLDIDLTVSEEAKAEYAAMIEARGKAAGERMRARRARLGMLQDNKG